MYGFNDWTGVKVPNASFNSSSDNSLKRSRIELSSSIRTGFDSIGTCSSITGQFDSSKIFSGLSSHSCHSYPKHVYGAFMNSIFAKVSYSKFWDYRIFPCTVIFLIVETSTCWYITFNKTSRWSCSRYSSAIRVIPCYSNRFKSFKSSIFENKTIFLIKRPMTNRSVFYCPGLIFFGLSKLSHNMISQKWKLYESSSPVYLHQYDNGGSS